MNLSKVFWGFFLLVIGSLLLLRSFDLLQFNFWSLWRLWPMILVFIGISILPIKDYIKSVLLIVALAFSIFLVFSESNSSNPFQFRFDRSYGDNDEYFENRDRFDRDYFIDENGDEKDAEEAFTLPWEGEIESVELDFEAVAGSYVIGSDTRQLIDFSQSGDLFPFRYSVEGSDDKREVEIGLEHGIQLNNPKNKVNMMLSKKPEWQIQFDAGAAKVEADLSKLKVTKLDVDGGACELSFRLGDKVKTADVKINAGAASVEIYVPKEAGCRLKTETVLSSKSLEGFSRKENGYYMGDGYDDAEFFINIDIDAAFADVRVIRY